MKLPSPLFYSPYRSPLGDMLLAATERALAGVWFTDQRHAPSALVQAAWSRADKQPLLQVTVQQLEEYFAGQRRQFEVPLDLSSGSPFQQQVWQALQGIAPGHTVSYGHLSQTLGKPTAVRAVGAAIGRNPISIIVPCHRVVGSQGALTGYAGGLARKASLLQAEGYALHSGL